MKPLDPWRALLDKAAQDFVPPEGEDDIDLKPHREMVRGLRAWVEGLLG